MTAKMAPTTNSYKKGTVKIQPISTEEEILAGMILRSSSAIEGKSRRHGVKAETIKEEKQIFAMYFKWTGTAAAMNTTYVKDMERFMMKYTKFLPTCS